VLEPEAGEPERAYEVVYGPLSAGEDVQDLSPSGLGAALNASAVVAARAIRESYTDIGICQDAARLAGPPSRWFARGVNGARKLPNPQDAIPPRAR